MSDLDHDELAAIAAAAPDKLDVDDLLDSLLRRIPGLLDVDTAAVLLLDASRRNLVARAAYGVEEEVRQGVSIPVGRGFAGRIAAERRPVALERVDATTVENPILWGKGIHSMLGVPLEHSGELLGVLHVGALTSRHFSPEDTMKLERIAQRVAEAIRAREVAVERSAARVLQRSLLPGAMPECEAIEFATRYVPAQLGGVGGDWYDAFVLPDGRLWVMAGDAAGHGLAAAVIMGRVRSTLRAYALEVDDPAEALDRANRKLEFFEPGATATVLCGVFAPDHSSLRLASAGHLPPVVATPGEPARLVEVPAAPPLGVLHELRVTSRQLALPLGATLVAYTDGLIERAGESLEVGFGQLVAAVHATHPERLCRELMDALVGSFVPRDDIAIVALRRVV